MRAAACDPACDAAVVRSILHALGDTAGIDWSLPLMDLPQDQVISFLLAAWQLIAAAEAHGSEDAELDTFFERYHVRYDAAVAAGREPDSLVALGPEKPATAIWNEIRPGWKGIRGGGMR
jgi:hypothetical protein